MGNKNSGPRPKPTALRLLMGVTRRDRLNPDEPVPPAGEVVEPAGLSRGGRQVWAELAPLALAMRTLTTADVRVFGTLCELQATLQRASRAKDSKVPEVAAGGVKLEKEVAAVIRPYYALFGLEPVSRARIAVAKPAEAAPVVSKWAGALK